MAQLHMASIIIYLKMLTGKPEKDRKKTQKQNQNRLALPF